MVMSEREIAQAKYNARDRDFVATVGLSTHVELLPLQSGKWRAYLSDFVTCSPRGFDAETKEVVRDVYGNIITGADRIDLLTKLKTEYPGWRWDKT